MSDDTSSPAELVVLVHRPIASYLDVLLTELEAVFRVRYATDLDEWEQLVEANRGSKKMLLSLMESDDVLTRWRSFLPFPAGSEKSLIILTDPITARVYGPGGEASSILDGAHETIFLLARAYLEMHWMVEQILHRAIWQHLWRQGMRQPFENVPTSMRNGRPVLDERRSREFLQRVIHLRNRRYADAFAPIEGKKEH